MWWLQDFCTLWVVREVDIQCYREMFCALASAHGSGTVCWCATEPFCPPLRLTMSHVHCGWEAASHVCGAPAQPLESWLSAGVTPTLLIHMQAGELMRTLPPQARHRQHDLDLRVGPWLVIAQQWNLLHSQLGL